MKRRECCQGGIVSFAILCGLFLAGCQDMSSDLNVVNGSGSGTYSPVQMTEIKANDAPEGYAFDCWTGDIEGVTEVTKPETTVVMRMGETRLEATYKLVSCNLAVVRGNGSGTYAADQTVSIDAEAPANGDAFDTWVGDVDGVADISNPNTTIYANQPNLRVEATYRSVSCVLDVMSGTGGGTYAMGLTVPINANSPPSGQTFDCWVGDVEGVSDVDNPNTTIYANQPNLRVEATYKSSGGGSTPPPPSDDSCGCDLSGPLVDSPTKGGEALVPYGKDIRCRCVNSRGADTVFIGDLAWGKHRAISVSGNTVTAKCFTEGSYRYHVRGWRAPSSASPLHYGFTGQYQATYRIDWECRRLK